MSNDLVNDITPETKASLKSRLIVAAILIIVLVPAFVLGGWVFFAFVSLFLALAIYEIIKAPQKKYHWWVWVLTYLVTLGYVYWFVLKVNLEGYQRFGSSFVFSLEDHYSSLVISTVALAVAVCGYFLIAILDKDFDFGDTAYFITTTLLIGLGFQSFIFLRYYPFYLFGYSPQFSTQIFFQGASGNQLIDYANFKYAWSMGLCLFGIVGATANDTFAYFGGLLFGKHKMNPRISPHKTWEGFFYGLGGAFVCCLVIGLVMAATGYPILPTLTIDKWYWILLLSIAIPLLGDLGDLSLSLIKRHWKIKDFGSILPGHGGILDRVDSDMFVCVGLAIMVIFITNGWNIAL